MNYRSAIIYLLDRVTDEKLIRRVWRLLEMAYNRQEESNERDSGF